MKKAIYVLYVNGGIMNRGGIESFMMNYFRHIDRKRVHIDFLVHGYEKGAYDDEIIANGSLIYHVPVKSKHPFIYQKKLKEIFSSGKYQVVHSHLDAMSCWILKIAKKCSIPVRIAHSHNTDHLTTNKLKYWINEQARKKICKYTTINLACSQAAGKWLFGNSAFIVIPNAIEADKFKFNNEVRVQIRRELGISDNMIVLGHVGRFDTQKNHKFLIDAFYKASQYNKNLVLMLIGDGWMKKTIQEKVNQYKLNGKVLFLGTRNDVNYLYNAMDVYVFPSLFEGLSVVLVEAQTNGLHCVVSDRVSTEVNITNTIEFLPLNLDIWIDKLLSEKQSQRFENEDTICNQGYEIVKAAKKLEDMYCNCLEINK